MGKPASFIGADDARVCRRQRGQLYQHGYVFHAVEEDMVVGGTIVRQQAFAGISRHAYGVGQFVGDYLGRFRFWPFYPVFLDGLQLFRPAFFGQRGCRHIHHVLETLRLRQQAPYRLAPVIVAQHQLVALVHHQLRFLVHIVTKGLQGSACLGQRIPCDHYLDSAFG